jgi:hypothetical protein
VPISSEEFNRYAVNARDEKDKHVNTARYVLNFLKSRSGQGAFSDEEIAQSIGIGKAEVETAIELSLPLDIMAAAIRGEPQVGNVESVVVDGIRYYRYAE